ncbi:hypothetical protein ACFVYP_35995 [Kitasatospora sp. NPDC058201]|uniref:hypothetical protein n=1 Tax=unclassified Kitasatospora TaxID=2633591 RepID=UPI0036592123
MVKNHARKNAARARAAKTGESHQSAVAAVREQPSPLPPPPTAEEILAEGRATIVAALGELAQQTTHPQRRALYMELQVQQEVEASTTFADMHKARGTFALRQADGYWLDRWNALSANPAGTEGKGSWRASPGATGRGGRCTSGSGPGSGTSTSKGPGY